MSGFVAQIDENAAGAYEEAQASSGTFPPLPKGKYQATIVPLKKDGSQLAEVVDFSKKEQYAGKKAVRIALKIVDESPTGAKRYFFERIPLFTRYAPTDKNPQGAPARAYFDFFGALGVAKDDLLSGRLPGPQDIMGKSLTITLSDPIKPDQYNELGSNEVSFYDAPGDISSTPIQPQGQPVAPWLDADGNLIVSGAGQQGAAPASGGQQSPWGGGTVTPGPWANAAGF